MHDQKQIAFAQRRHKREWKAGELLKQRWPGYKLTELAFKVVASLFMRASLERHNRKESINGGGCHSSNQEKSSSDSSCQQRMTLDNRHLLSSFAVLKAFG